MQDFVLQLPDDMKEFVEIEATRVGLRSPQDFIVQLIRDAQRKKAIAYLEHLAEESLQSGPATPLTHEDFESIRRMLHEKYGSASSKTARTRELSRPEEQTILFGK